jgi:hypothetical protein
VRVKDPRLHVRYQKIKISCMLKGPVGGKYKH